MGKVSIRVDDELLAAAAGALGTITSAETVNAALREAVERHRRVKAFDQLAEMAAAGDFDLLLDKQNYRPRPAI